MDSIEEWRDIPGEAGYQASSLGRIKGRRGVLKPSFNPVSGHGTVTVSDRRTRYVHHMVCIAFHGLRPADRPVCLHLDGDSANNRADNLAWGTHKENAAHRMRDHGRIIAEVRALRSEVGDLRRRLEALER